MSVPGQEPPLGIEQPAVDRWFAENIPGAEPPFSYDLIAGGKSNLTYRVTDAAGRSWSLRRPPMGTLAASAHDMSREWRLLTALHGHVPVPRPVAMCTDESITGRPFHVTDWVDGLVVRSAADVDRVLEPGLRVAASRSLVQTLAQLHAVVPDEVGLGDLGRSHGYIERQLKRWKAQYDQTRTTDRPHLDEVYERLSGSVPSQGSVSIVHADYRFDNTVLSSAGEVLAVVDWELCTLGDPLADVAAMLIYWQQPGEQSGMSYDWPQAAGGFLSREEVIAAYAEASGRDVSDLDYYLAFAHWRAACIGEGAFARAIAGAAGDAVRDDAASLESGTVYHAGLAADAIARLDALDPKGLDEITRLGRGSRGRSLMGPGKSPKDGRWRATGDRGETEARLEEAALELLAEEGLLAGLNLRQVADRVGVNRGLVYHYFGSRRELLQSALRRRGQELAHRVRRRRRGRPFPERVADDLREVASLNGYALITTLVLDGDRAATVMPLKDESLLLLSADRDAQRIPSDADLEALHVLIVAAIAGYSLFRGRFAAELEIGSGELDERLAILLEQVLGALNDAESGVA